MFIPDNPIPRAPDPPKGDTPKSGNAIREVKRRAPALGYRTPEQRNRECPVCGEPGFEGVWVDVGVGEQQVQPARCNNCKHVDGQWDKDPSTCPHDNIVDDSTGSRWLTPTGPTDDIEEHKLCLDCGARDEELLSPGDPRRGGEPVDCELPF